MITWADGSQPVMRRAVRGHGITYSGLADDMSGRKAVRVAVLHCFRCGSRWTPTVGWATRNRMSSPDRFMARNAVAGIVAVAVSRTPTCEEAYLARVAREVIET